MRFLSLIVVLLALSWSSGEEENARLLVSKNVLNQYLVEGKDVTVLYQIHNVGGSSALDVQLKDDSFPPEMFDVVSGSFSVGWSRIAPGTNVTHALITRPLKSGVFNFTAAQVTYKPSEDAQLPQFGYTSAPGQGGIMNFKDYDRKFSPHVLDWAAFAVMTLPSLGIPFLLWYSSKSKYDNIKSKKN